MTAITLLTASYNSAGTIGDTLRSVAAQTYPGIEHILIDGASKDDTLAVAEREGRHLAQVVSERDKGIYDAYNKGIALANGEIIGFINSDDFYAHDRVIERVMQVFADLSVDGVHSDLVYVDPEDTTKAVRHWRSREATPSALRHGYIPAHPTVFLRRSVYDKVGLFNLDYRLAADYDFLLRVFNDPRFRTVYVPEIWVRMRTGGATGGSLADIRRQNDEILAARERHGVRYPASLFFARKVVDRLLQRVRARFVRLPKSAA